MKSKNLLLIAFTLLIGAIANASPRLISSADVKWSTNSIGHLQAYIDITGLIDRPEGDGVYRNGANAGYIQYRLPGGAWTNVGGPASGPVTGSGWDTNGRFLFANHVTYSNLELRVCNNAEGCSAPYVVNLTPKILKFVGATPGLVSKGQPILKVWLKDVMAGGLNFQISQHRFNSFGVRQISRITDGILVGGCTAITSTTCDVQVPAEILETPGDFMLSVSNSLGGHETLTKFQVVEPAKVIILTDGLRSKLLSIVKLVIPPQNASQLSIKVKSPLCLTPIDGPILDNTETEVIVKIPPPCLPEIGDGELELEVRTRNNRSTHKLRYEVGS
jgi:hypothetical protein